MSEQQPELAIQVYPLTPDRWPDLETLFGRYGASGGCWCMYWRLPGKDFTANGGPDNRALFKNIVDSGKSPGLLAYVGNHPVGWCSVAPREDFLPRLERSRYWKPVEGQGVWSIVCFYIHRNYRGQQLATRLLAAAVEYARQHGARSVESYPKEIGEARVHADSIYVGTVKMYRDAGFEEIARRHPARPIMRKPLP